MCLLLWWSRLTGKPIKTNVLTDRFSRGPDAFHSHVENDIYSIWKNGSGFSSLNASAQFMGCMNRVNKRQETLLCLVFWSMNCTERSNEEETLLQRWNHISALHMHFQIFVGSQIIYISVEFGWYESDIICLSCSNLQLSNSLNGYTFHVTLLKTHQEHASLLNSESNSSDSSIRYNTIKYSLMEINMKKRNC